jgi:undecaprenyl-diphosphatase
VGAVLLLALFWGLGEIARAYAGGVDLSAVRDLASVRTPALTGLARVMSVLGSSYVVLPLAAVVGSLLLLRRRVRHAGLIVVSVFGAVLIENLDKLLVKRPRPPVEHLETVSSPSFPSGHASQSAAICASAIVLASILLPSRGRAARVLRLIVVSAALFLAFAIAFSRIYLGVHYPTDVAAGLVLGGAWTGLVWLGLHRKTGD